MMVMETQFESGLIKVHINLQVRSSYKSIISFYRGDALLLCLFPVSEVYYRKRLEEGWRDCSIYVHFYVNMLIVGLWPEGSLA